MTRMIDVARRSMGSWLNADQVPEAHDDGGDAQRHHQQGVADAGPSPSRAADEVGRRRAHRQCDDRRHRGETQRVADNVRQRQVEVVAALVGEQAGEVGERVAAARVQSPLHQRPQRRQHHEQQRDHRGHEDHVADTAGAAAPSRPAAPCSPAWRGSAGSGRRPAGRDM